MSDPANLGAGEGATIMTAAGARMHQIDYAGPTGGLLALAFAAGCVAATVFWLGIAATIWRIFVEPRFKQLEADRIADNVKCDEALARANAQILQLQTMLMVHGPQALRQDMQLALSEERLTRIGRIVDELKRERDFSEPGQE